MAALEIPFTKMNGLGNDFVIFDNREKTIAINSTIVKDIAARDKTLGCDQVVLLETSKKANAFMRIFNADGSEAGACGNAARCVFAYLDDENATTYPIIETRAGLLFGKYADDGQISIDMGQPRFGWQDIPLVRAFHDTRMINLTYVIQDGRVLDNPSVVNVGNPHCIFFVSDAASFPLQEFGSQLEHHPFFPERANISLAEIVSPNSIILRVWERGAGLTKACGTGACAAVVAAVRLEKTERKVQVELPGGKLLINWREEDDHIIMTGPATFEFNGIVYVNGNQIHSERSQMS